MGPHYYYYSPNSSGGNCKLAGKRQLFMGSVAAKKGKLSLLTSFCEEDTVPNSNALHSCTKGFFIGIVLTMPFFLDV